MSACVKKNPFISDPSLSRVARSLRRGGLSFSEPLVPAPAADAVILSTYFASRVDPLHCWQYIGGHLPRNSFTILRPWYDAVERLGLSAVVFHDDALSPEYAAGSQTATVKFQHVQLGRLGWSLNDERWEVYRRWLETPAGSSVRYVLHVDPQEAIIAHDPFLLMKSQESEFQLWLHSQPAARHATERAARCLPASPAAESDATFLDGAVVGGPREAFVQLTGAVVDELERMNAESRADAWNCQGPVLNSLLAGADAAQAGPLAGLSVFRGGYPFSGSSSQCIQEGICDFAVYRN